MGEDQALVSRVATWMRGGKAPPHLIEMRPTDWCNLACRSCVGRELKVKRGRPYEQGDELDDAELLRVAGEAVAMGGRRFEITGGGEPLFRGGATLKALALIKKSGAGGQIVTNGTLIDGAAAAKLVDMGWDEVFLSLDGPDETVNDKLRGKGTFSKVVCGLAEIEVEKKAARSALPRVVLGPVLSAGNFEALDGFIPLAEKFGVRDIVFQPLGGPSGNRVLKRLMLTPAQRKKFSGAAARFARLCAASGITSNIEEFDRRIVDKSTRPDRIAEADANEFRDPLLSIPCFSPWMFMGIMPDGGVASCPIIDASPEYLPSVKNVPLEAIWEGEVFRETRERLASGRLMPKCRYCCGSLVMKTRRIRRQVAAELGRVTCRRVKA